MFSERFNQLATLVGIDTVQLISKCDAIEEEFKDKDKADINIAVDWLDKLSKTINPNELSFLLMTALSPDSSLEDQEDDMEDFFSMMEEQGFTKLPNGVWVRPVEINGSEEERKEIPEDIKLLPEPAGYLPATEPNRNALGYDHSQETLLNAIGLDGDLLNSKIKLILKQIPEGIPASRSIETFEREFTRKELSYMYTYKVKRYDELLESSSKEILELENKINTITTKKRRTTTKNKKDNGTI